MTAIIIILFLMALFVGAWYVCEIGHKSDALRYLERIILLERLIDNCLVDSDSFDYIMKEFDEINRFREKDLRRNQEAFVR
ncbi:MAG: hypothetical protein KKB31_01615, partial [Nanoarchaeota archaeon]|nr:hypothetical protein [Nanoarchaeota archaeon]